MGIAVVVGAGIVAVALTQHGGPEPAGGSVPVQVERPVGFPSRSRRWQTPSRGSPGWFSR